MFVPLLSDGTLEECETRARELTGGAPHVIVRRDDGTCLLQRGVHRPMFDPPGKKGVFPGSNTTYLFDR